jgi:hypothetical protein
MAKTEQVSGHVTASVLISVLAGLASGAIYGGILGSFIGKPYLIAVIAALLAVVTATVLRYFLLFRGSGSPPPGGVPLLDALIVNAAIASVFGGLAAHAILLEAAPQLEVRPVVTGAAAGLCGGILMALLMLVYYSARAEGASHPRRG